MMMQNYEEYPNHMLICAYIFKYLTKKGIKRTIYGTKSTLKDNIKLADDDKEILFLHNCIHHLSNSHGRFEKINDRPCQPTYTLKTL